MPFRLRSDPRRDVLSSATHSNWYRFETDAFSRLDLQLRSYPLLGAASVSLEPDDELGRAVSELVRTGDPAAGLVRLTGLIAPGGIGEAQFQLVEVDRAALRAPGTAMPRPAWRRPGSGKQAATGKLKNSLSYFCSRSPRGPLASSTSIFCPEKRP